MRKELVLTVALAILLLLAACSASQDEAPIASGPAQAAVVEETNGGEAPAAEEMAPEAESQPEYPDAGAEMVEDMAGESEEMATGLEEVMNPDAPAWQTLALTNARTGESFTLADFAGKTVFVEPMATWCTNCRRQLSNVRDARSQLAADDVVFVGLSVETAIADATLASYANDAGFDWLFAVVTPELLREMAGEFGQTIANPPATPHFIIRADGTTTELVTGIEPTGQIVAQIEAARG